MWDIPLLILFPCPLHHLSSTPIPFFHFLLPPLSWGERFGSVSPVQILVFCFAVCGSIFIVHLMGSCGIYGSTNLLSTFLLTQHAEQLDPLLHALLFNAHMKYSMQFSKRVLAVILNVGLFLQRGRSLKIAIKSIAIMTLLTWCALFFC